MINNLLKLFFIQQKTNMKHDKNLLAIATAGVILFAIVFVALIYSLNTVVPRLLEKKLVEFNEIIIVYFIFTYAVIFLKNIFFGPDFEFSSKYSELNSLPIKRYEIFITDLILSFLKIRYILLSILFIVLTCHSVNHSYIYLLYMYFSLIMFTHLSAQLIFGLFLAISHKSIPGIKINLKYFITILIFMLVYFMNSLKRNKEFMNKQIEGLLLNIIDHNSIKSIANIFLPESIFEKTIAILVSLAINIILAFILYRLYTLINYKMSYSPGNDKKGNYLKIIKLIRIINSRLGKYKQLLFLLHKELLYIYRSPRMRNYFLYVLILNFTFTVFNSFKDSSFFSLFALSIGAMVISSETIVIWRYDHKGAELYFTLPVRIKDVIIVKNIAYSIYIFIIQIFSLITILFFRPELISLKNVIISFPIVLLAYILIIFLANYYVVEEPEKIDFNSVFTPVSHTKTVNIIITFVLSFYILFIFILSLFNAVIIAVVLFIMIIIALFVYIKSLNYYAENFMRSRDFYLKSLT